MGGKTTVSRGPTALPKSRGTGFEEYFADPPMTPAEAKEERENIYSPLIPFVDRIQSCIQRFRSRRRITGTESTQLFNQYLFLGGVDTSPRLFGGNIDADTEGMTPDERRTATATDVVYTSGGGSRFYNADEPEGWDVDFAGVAAGFLSENLPAMANWDYLRMGKAIGIIESFLTYILQHDVCPEYTANIKEAMAVCNLAKIDLPLAHQALIHFPGHFNLALSEMFCEGFDYIHDDDTAGFARPKDFDPTAVVKLAMGVGMICMGVDKTKATSLIHAVNNPKTSKVKMIFEEEISMQVINIHRASFSVREIIAGVRTNGGMPDGFAPLGKLVLKPCIIEDGYDHGNYGDASDDETHTFLVDDDILARMMPGFKLQLCVVHLNNGVSFIKQVKAVLVSWHTYLPQNLMTHFKEPVENDRPAPTVKNPNAEDYNDSFDKSLSDE
ncbi:Argonaute-binding protein 1 [Colletotrichum aenigma]|uniref:Argonaute-binding protein 1 n=1 Tax=Colletotrichum aenigma TaxID=1215731 RepID=UPI0018728C1A|nr:Argonaute-binding protein 1 [Colletotrichum aenigma]KAF5520684.1 Argonaute-binding protein 1 [Colletotrichum aenigma]